MYVGRGSTCRRFPVRTDQCFLDRVRSCSPLRDSRGIAPRSLSRCAAQSANRHPLDPRRVRHGAKVVNYFFGITVTLLVSARSRNALPSLLSSVTELGKQNDQDSEPVKNPGPSAAAGCAKCGCVLADNARRRYAGRISDGKPPVLPHRLSDHGPGRSSPDACFTRDATREAKHATGQPVR